jgi:hypothetical protein
MKNQTDTAAAFYRIFYKVFGIVAIVILGMLSVCTLIWQPGVYMNSGEHVHFDRSGILFYVLLAAMGLLFLKIGRSRKKIRTGYVFGAFSIIYIAAGIYLLANMDVIPRSDPAMILKYADAFNAGDYSGLLPGRYLDRFPYQLGFLTYERLLRLIFKDYHFLAAVNLCLVLIINALIWRITDLVSDHDDRACFYSILLSFLFLPQFFYILWMYGQIPGLCCVLFSFWFLLRQVKDIGKWNWLPASVFLSLATLLKPNYMIAAAAFCCILFLHAIYRKSWKPLILLIFTVFMAIGSNRLLDNSYRMASGIPFGDGAPYVLTLAEGLQDTGPRIGGWYNGFEFDTYSKTGYDSEAAAEIGKEAFKERIIYLGNHPGYAVSFFGKKIVSSWCDPTFESIWSGALEDSGQYTHTFLLQSIFTAGVAYEVIKLFLHVILFIIYFCSMLFSVFCIFKWKTKTEPYFLFPVIYLTGGFLFHLISETKSQYTYMYVFCLIPIAAVMLSKTCDKINRKKGSDNCQTSGLPKTENVSDEREDS